MEHRMGWKISLNNDGGLFAIIRSSETCLLTTNVRKRTRIMQVRNLDDNGRNAVLYSSEMNVLGVADLMVPVLCSWIGSMFIPVSTAFPMSNTVGDIEHEINIQEIVRRIRRYSFLSTYIAD
jgi:hypothetical protein